VQWSSAGITALRLEWALPQLHSQEGSPEFDAQGAIYRTAPFFFSFFSGSSLPSSLIPPSWGSCQKAFLLIKFLDLANGFGLELIFSMLCVISTAA